MGRSLGGGPDVVMVSYIESRHLAALGDTLPPKLISGELRAK